MIHVGAGGGGGARKDGHPGDTVSEGSVGGVWVYPTTANSSSPLSFIIIFIIIIILIIRIS